MRISEIGKMSCPVARAVNVVGDPWTLMIMRELFLGSRRFDQFESYLGLSPRLLSALLKEPRGPAAVVCAHAVTDLAIKLASGAWRGWGGGGVEVEVGVRVGDVTDCVIV